MEQVVAYGETQGEPIKLFVGQIPKTWMEGEVRQILEPFGTIQELTVLKDRASGLHKGLRREGVAGKAREGLSS